jgi:hypothetical protein
MSDEARMAEIEEEIAQLDAELNAPGRTLDDWKEQKALRTRRRELAEEHSALAFVNPQRKGVGIRSRRVYE